MFKRGQGHGTSKDGHGTIVIDQGRCTGYHVQYCGDNGEFSHVSVFLAGGRNIQIGRSHHADCSVS